MANQFVNNRKLKLIAAYLNEKMPYLKGAGSLFSEAELKGKKTGMTVYGYLPDSGSVHKGIVASPDKVTEIPVSGVIKNWNTAVETELWDDILNIQDFRAEILEKRVQKLARTAQAEVMQENMAKSFQIAVSTTPNFEVLTDASSKLDELAVGGDVSLFLRPELHAKIAATGLAKYIFSNKVAEDLYGKNYLGSYGGADQIELALCPVVDTTGADQAPTISGTIIKDAANNVIGVSEIKEITGSGTGSIIPNVPYKLAATIVDQSGMETSQDFYVIPVTESYYDANGVEQTRVVIPSVRITAQGAAYANPNAVMTAAAIAAADDGNGNAVFTLTPVLDASSKYDIGQCRTVRGLSWDQYRWSTLAMAKADEVQTFENITVKAQTGSQILAGVNATRIDLGGVALLADPRESVTLYIKRA
jgi:hypothetical protein